MSADLAHDAGMETAERSERPSKITVPEKANALARLVFSEMQRQGVTYASLEWRSGVLISTFKAWRTDNSPGLLSISAALGALGWDLVPCPKISTLPQNLRDRLIELGEHFADEQQALAAAVQATSEWRASRKGRAPRTHQLAPGSLPARRFAAREERLAA